MAISLRVGFEIFLVASRIQPFPTTMVKTTSVLLSIIASTTTTAVIAWKWVPEDEHPCTVQQQFTLAKFLKKFGPRGLPPLYPEPVVLRRDVQNDDTNKEFRRMTEHNNLLEWFGPDFNVTLSSSNARSEHRRTTTLQQYIHETLTAFETTPNQYSNETWYLFGETYSDAWRKLLYPNYQLPPCQTCRADTVALSFGIGNRGSGVQWHVHGPGFSEALHGRKHWVLYPPSLQDAHDFPKDQSSRQWMEHVYTNLTAASLVLPVECTLNPGDLIYFPDRWWHATINLDPYTAFISTFTTEHTAVVNDGDDDLFSSVTTSAGLHDDNNDEL